MNKTAINKHIGSLEYIVNVHVEGDTRSRLLKNINLIDGLVNGAKCIYCGKVYDNENDVEYLSENRRCFMCDHLAEEAMMERMDQAEAHMESMGLDPENEEDVEVYMEMDRDC